MSNDDSVTLALWESAEEAILAAAVDEAGVVPCRRFAKAATVAVLRRLAGEIQMAEEDDVLWPDSDDLLILAGELEESDD